MWWDGGGWKEFWSLSEFLLSIMFCFNMGDRKNKVEDSGVIILLNELTLISFI